MHQVNLCVSGVTRLLYVINCLFCLCCLVHRANNMRELRCDVHHFLEKHLEITHVPPSAHQQEYARAVMTVLEWGDANDPQQMHKNHSSKREKRFEEQELCVALLAGLWYLNRVVHYCPFGCCNNRETAVQKCSDAITDVLFNRR